MSTSKGTKGGAPERVPLAKRAMNPAFFANKGAGAVAVAAAKQRDHAIVSGNAGVIGALRRSIETGVLNLSQRNLTAMPDELFRCVRGELDLGGNWWETNPITKVDLSHNNIAQLPEDLCVLGDLTVLLASSNKLEAVPACVFEQMPLLKQLHLNANRIRTLPSVLGRAPALVDLSLSANQLQHLPDAICELATLESLALDNNAIERLPERLGQLVRLKKLDLSGNRLGAVPESIDELRELRELSVKGNKLQQLPQGIRHLRALVILDVSENQLHSLEVLPHSPFLDTVLAANNRIHTVDPRCFERCPALSVLVLATNKLPQVPRAVASLQQLKTLDLSNNDLPDIPSELGCCGALTRIALDGNPIRCIRQALLRGPLTELKKFLRERLQAQREAESASSQQVVKELFSDNGAAHSSGGGNARQGGQGTTSSGQPAEMPRELVVAIRDAAASKQLVLAGKHLAALPHGAVSLPDLVSVDVSGNRLGQLPEECANWRGMQLAKLNDNLFESLPPCCLGWSALRELHAAGCRLVSPALSEPAMRLLAQTPRGIAWQQLAFADLSGNALTSVPSELLCAAPRLAELRLAGNRIADWGVLADGVAANLPPLALRTLDLSNNKLQSAPTTLPQRLPLLTALLLANNDLFSVPPCYGVWGSLSGLSLEGNPIRGIRHAVLAKGTVAVKEFLASRLPDANAQTHAPPPAHYPTSTAYTYAQLPQQQQQQQQPAAAPRRSDESSPRRRSQQGAPTYPQPDQPTYAPPSGPESDPPPGARLSRPSGGRSSLAGEDATVGPSARVQREALSAQVAELKRQAKELQMVLENPVGISSAKQFALKKDAARVNAERVKLERQLAQLL